MDIEDTKYLEGASGLKDFVDWCAGNMGENHIFFKQIALFMAVRVTCGNNELADIIDEFIQNTVFGYFKDKNHTK